MDTSNLLQTHALTFKKFHFNYLSNGLLYSRIFKLHKYEHTAIL